MKCSKPAALYLFFLPVFSTAPPTGMQDLSIDLRLAVNYLPACACVLQSTALSFLLCAVHSVRLLPAFVPVCLALVVHRASPRTLRIFDGSGVLFSLYLAHCVAALQEFGAGWWTLWPPLHAALSLEWPAAAGYLLCNPPSHRTRLQAFLALACAHASLFGFLHRPEGAEHRLVRVGRDLAFTGLCLVWTYVVGIYRRRLTREPSESSAHFAVYFWPVLYVHAYAALAYACLGLAVICAQLKAQAQTHEAAAFYTVTEPAAFHAEPSAQPFESPPDPLPSLEAGPAPEPDGEDELIFRQAMSARCGGVVAV